MSGWSRRCASSGACTAEACASSPTPSSPPPSGRTPTCRPSTTGFWNLAADESLLIETPEPKGDYWGFQLSNALWNTLDFANRQTSLNRTQAHVDDDGELNSCWHTRIQVFRTGWTRSATSRAPSTSG